MDAESRSQAKERGSYRAVAGLFIAMLALRPVVVEIGPLASSNATELGTTYAFIGLLTTISVICMAAFRTVGALARWSS